MKRELTYDDSIVVIKLLAYQIGLNESIVLKQIIDWVDLNKKTGRNLKDGLYWTYNTYDDLHDQLPFFSVSTIRRIIRKLELSGVLISSENYNKMRKDKTKWYTYNLDNLSNMHVKPIKSLSKLNTPLPSINKDKTFKDKEKTIFLKQKIEPIHPDSTDPNYLKIKSFIDRYMNNYYVQKYNKPHSALKHDQYMRVFTVLNKFFYENLLVEIDLDYLATTYFDEVNNKKHNINAFATEGMLKVLALRIGLLSGYES